MSEELFAVPESSMPELEAARLRLAKAQEEYDGQIKKIRAGYTIDERDAANELSRAKRHLAACEQREINTR